MSKKPKDLKMFLKDSDASKRIGNFTKMKHNVLSQVIGKPESTNILYRKDEFIALLNTVLSNGSTGLRVYFASYPTDGDPVLIPAGLEDTLTLIYAPTLADNGVEKDMGDYYIKDVNNNITSLAKNEASAWVANFQSKKWPVLNAILENYDANTKETQNISYNRDAIQDLYDFLVNADHHSTDIPDVIAIFFAAYHLKEHGNVNYEHKLTLVIAFMNVFYYQGKEYYYYENSSENDKFDVGGSGDTGVPCPPPPSGTTCPGATLP